MTRDAPASRPTATGRRLRRSLPVTAADGRWLLAAVLPACLAVAVYLATNPYPAYGGGLYVKIAGEIGANGYRPPARIPGYTADGVPFAYPPLQFYVLAVLHDLGADPIAITRILPGVAVVAAQVPVYLLARDYTGSRPGGAAAAAAVALNPQTLEWHVSAGGVVRAFAFLYALTAIYAGYHVFASGDRRAVAAGAVAFGLTVLTHPTYSLFVVVTYLLLWGVRDRSAVGLLRGAAVGLGGALIASPWLAWVVATHGPGVFVAASGTHGGIGGGLDALAGGVSPFVLVPLGVAAVAVALRRAWFPFAWIVAAILLFDQPRFAYAAGAVAAAAAAVAAVGRFALLERRDAGPDRRAVAATLVILAASLGGGAYLAHEMTLVADPSTPEFVDDEDVAAMEWAATETGADATFVVLGDAAEWFPALTDRTILIGPWGVEWVTADAYDRHLETYVDVSACRSVTCVETRSERFGAPEYVYVPRGQYTIRGGSAVQFGTVERSFDRSPAWEPAYENDGVVVYRARDSR